MNAWLHAPNINMPGVGGGGHHFRLFSTEDVPPMRVRHLQTHLADQGLVNSSKLSELLALISAWLCFLAMVNAAKHGPDYVQ